MKKLTAILSVLGIAATALIAYKVKKEFDEIRDMKLIFSVCDDNCDCTELGKY